MAAPEDSGWGGDVNFPLVEVDSSLKVFRCNRQFSAAFGNQLTGSVKPLFPSSVDVDCFLKTVARVLRTGCPEVFRAEGDATGSTPAISLTVLPQSTSLNSSDASRICLAIHPAITTATDEPGVPDGETLDADDGPSGIPNLLLRFMEQMPAIGWVRDPQHRYVYINPAYRKQYQLRNADRIGKTPGDVWPESVARAFLEHDELVHEKHAPMSFIESAPAVDGTTQLWFNTKFELLDRQRRLCIAGFGVNVTQISSLDRDSWIEATNREIDRVRAQAEEEARLISLQQVTSLAMLLSGAVHDFNNHLAAITLFSTLVREGVAANSPIANYATQIEQAAAAAGQLCQQLMGFRARGVSLGFRLVDLTQVIEHLSELIRTMVRHPVEIRFHLLDDPPMVLGDPVQIRQIIMNLVINAAEACDVDGKIEVRMSVAEQGTLAGGDLEERYLVIEVDDNGTGIPPELTAQVFEPYFTTKPNGHGIGLAAAAAIAERHRALLDLLPAPVRGTIARLAFPLRTSVFLHTMR